jgi:hopene-associated glycosyltransferase HpnB
MGIACPPQRCLKRRVLQNEAQTKLLKTWVVQYLMLIAAGILSVVIWGYLMFARGQFWRIQAPSPGRLADVQLLRIAVIVPARDEAEFVGQAVKSLLQQAGPPALHVFLVDDGSSDGTARVAQDAANTLGRSEALTIIESRPLPPGWSGKLWALHQGAERAQEFQPDYFLFTDADIVHMPDNIAKLLSIAKSRNCDLASFMVKLHCKSLAEKLLIPAFVYFFFKLYPPAWTADRRRATAGAAGGCLLVRPTALEAGGGIAAIRHEVIDDCALAARIKDNGGGVWLGASDTACSIRPYRGFSGLGAMISRTAFNQLRHSSLLLVLATAGMAATYLLPPALTIFSHRLASALLGGAAWLLMVLSFLPVLRSYRLSPLWSAALPLVALFYMGATIHSAWKYWFGRGGEWKGRVQDPVRQQR